MLQNVDEVFTALDFNAFAAVGEYFAGAVLLLKPDADALARFEVTRRRDAGR